VPNFTIIGATLWIYVKVWNITACMAAKLLYKPLTRVIGKGDFDSHNSEVAEPILTKLEI